MKKTILLVLLTLGTFSFAQEQEQEQTPSKKWFLGVGFNLMNNNALDVNEFFSLKDANVIPMISAFTVQRKWDNNFSVAGQFFLNQYNAKNMHDGKTIAKSLTYTSANLNAMYTFDQHLVDVKWFDATVIGGLGAFWADKTSNYSFNTGLAFDFWVSKDVALRLETQGKFAFDEKSPSTNHIVHSFSVILPIK